jgi:3-oxoacyl-[acyl-carrier protein] reductase
MPSEQRVAIVTGSATGIGAAVAQRLAASGVRIVINYSKSKIEAEATAAACKRAGGEALLYQCDVSSDGDCRAMVAATAERWGRVDYLVNSAGTTKHVDHKNLDGLTAEDFQRIYSVNVIGAFQMARAAAPHMKKTGNAAIVNVSSTAGLRGTGSSIAYAASKAALNNVTVSLARVLAPEIRVNVVCPGFVKTRWMKEGIGEEKFTARIASWEALSPLKMSSTPDDVAQTITWFLTDATHLTGECLRLDDGTHLVTPRR